ncbi:MAG: hypothetical protein V2I45_04685 [Halieaceae bacterium]|jgi:hypothetical protein|nr:hypothetical protein [Halieaceae bacterium]
MALKSITNDPATLFANAHWCFAARRVDQADAVSLHQRYSDVAPGDLILARVLEIGQHRGIQLRSGRRATLSPGDLIVMPCGARYAPDQFEGVAEIDPAGTDMLAGGGCLGRMRHRNERVRPATRVLPLGCIADRHGNTLNLASYTIDAGATPSQVPLIAVVGTSMNSGKTLATAKLSHGLHLAGLRVGAIKATGTGAFGDYHQYLDSGAHYVADFTDVGMATTYLTDVERIKQGIWRLLNDAEQAGCEVVVMEIADGLLQKETAQLLADPTLRARLSGLVFACSDAVAAQGGAALLAAKGHRISALTGMLSCSPMAAQEASAATGLRVLSKSELAEPSEALAILRAESTTVDGAQFGSAPATIGAALMA